MPSPASVFSHADLEKCRALLCALDRGFKVPLNLAVVLVVALPGVEDVRFKLADPFRPGGFPGASLAAIGANARQGDVAICYSARSIRNSRFKRSIRSFESPNNGRFGCTHLKIRSI